MLKNCDWNIYSYIDKKKIKLAHKCKFYFSIQIKLNRTAARMNYNIELAGYSNLEQGYIEIISTVYRECSELWKAVESSIVSV